MSKYMLVRAPGENVWRKILIATLSAPNIAGYIGSSGELQQPSCHW